MLFLDLPNSKYQESSFIETGKSVNPAKNRPELLLHVNNMKQIFHGCMFIQFLLNRVGG